MGPAYSSEAAFDLQRYWHTMEPLGVTYAVVVQPSTHRFDTTITLAGVAQDPDRLRAVVCQPVDTPLATWIKLKEIGVVGTRLNMIHNPDQSSLPSVDFLKKLRDAGLFLQVFSRGRKLAEIVEMALQAGTTLVVDHLGNPDPEMDTDQPGFVDMLQAAREGEVYIKLSAPFRMTEDDRSFKIATQFARVALETVPLTRFLAGTDWPFINCGNVPEIASIFDWLHRVLPHKIDRQKVTNENPRRLLT